MKTLIFMILSCLLSSCVTGPTNKASGLEKLNGANYEQGNSAILTGTGMLLPIIKRRDVSTQISGVLQLDQSGIPSPLVQQKIQLEQEGKIFGETTSLSGGVFSFSIAIPDGQYLLKIISDRYKGTQAITINGLKVDGIQFVVKQK
jgi:hypothetical protein